jgi:hypothetical protein
MAWRKWRNRHRTRVRVDVSFSQSPPFNYDLISLPVFYLRLFYTEGLLGWNSDEWPIYLRWILLVVLCVMLTNTIFFRVLRRRPFTQKYGGVLLFANLLAVILMAIFFFIAGRVSMLPLPTGVHEMSKYGCCAQAVVYPRTKVPLYVQPGPIGICGKTSRVRE